MVNNEYLNKYFFSSIINIGDSMKDINVWDTNLANNFSYYNDINELINLIRENKIKNFNVVNKYCEDVKASIDNYYLYVIKQ